MPRGRHFPRKQVENLRDAALANAEHLDLDCRFLYRNGSFARSVSIGILAIEEMAKTVILNGMLSRDAAGKSVDWRFLQRLIDKHEFKLVTHFSILTAVAAGTPSESQLKKFISGKGGAQRLAASFEDLKEKGFYAGLFQGKVCTPAKVITADHAGGIIGFLDNLRTLRSALGW